MTTEAKTVNVPKKHISRLIQNVLDEWKRTDSLDRPAGLAIKYLIDNPAGLADNPDEPVALPATIVFDLYMGSAAYDTYDLDDTAAETYEHPAVVAEIEVFQILFDHAPKLLDRPEAGAR